MPSDNQLGYTTSAGGRPTEFSDEIIEHYADELLEWMQDPQNIWLKDFCLERLINPENMSIWEKKNDKFSQVYKLAKAYQESRILKGGLTSNYNSNIVKLVLSKCHQGWTEEEKTQSVQIALLPMPTKQNVKELLEKQFCDDDNTA